MIYKSYVLENNINSPNEKIILFYGENLGLKNDLKRKIIYNNKNSEILRFTQEELTKNNRVLINEIQKITKSGTPVYGKFKERSYENLRLVPDIKKAKKILNWKPTTSLKLGLKKTLKYIKKYER